MCTQRPDILYVLDHVHARSRIGIVHRYSVGRRPISYTNYIQNNFYYLFRYAVAHISVRASQLKTCHLSGCPRIRTQLPPLVAFIIR